MKARELPNVWYTPFLSMQSAISWKSAQRVRMRRKLYLIGKRINNSSNKNCIGLKYNTLETHNMLYIHCAICRIYARTCTLYHTIAKNSGGFTKYANRPIIMKYLRGNSYSSAGMYLYRGLGNMGLCGRFSSLDSMQIY